MRPTIFNNPAIGEGLGQLVEAYIGNPEQEARTQILAAQAKEAMLKSRILDQFVGPVSAGSGGLPTGDLGSLVSWALGGSLPKSGGRGGGGSGGAKASSGPARALTQAEIGRINRYVKAKSIEGPDALTVTNAIINAYNGGGFKTADEAAADVLGRTSYTENVINPHDSWWPTDWVRGPETERQLTIGDAPPPSGTPSPAAPAGAASAATAPAPSQPGTDEVSVLNQAREAIARGADPKAVAQRVISLGIDPGKI